MNFYFLYYLLNTKTNKGYIGYTNDLNRRLYDHIKALEENVHPNKKLQNDHISDCLEIKILETYFNKDNKFICEREKALIKKYNTFNNGYNQTQGGETQVNTRVYTEDNIFKAYALLRFYPETSSKVIQNLFEMSESSVLRLKNKRVHLSIVNLFEKMPAERKEVLKTKLDKEFNMEERIAKHNSSVKYKSRHLDREEVLMVVAVGQNRVKKGAHMERKLGLSGSHSSRIVRGVRYKEFFEEYENMSAEDKSIWLNKGLNFFQLE